MSPFPHFTPHAVLLAKASALVHTGPIHLEGMALANMATLQRRARATSELGPLPKFSLLALSINVGIYGGEHPHVQRMAWRNSQINAFRKWGVDVPVDRVH